MTAQLSHLIEGLDGDRARFYTCDEAGRLLSTSGRTVLRMITDGRLPGVNIGTRLRPRWRVPESALMEMAK